MCKDKIKDEIKNILKNIHSKSEEYKKRPAQREMIANIYKTFNKDKNRSIIIEAPTGVGKTLAYLISAIPIAILKEKTLVVSTATHILQQQILEKDLPIVQKNSSLEIKSALVKGMGSFLCIRNLFYLIKKIPLPGYLLDKNISQNDILQDLYDDYANKKWDGDFSNYQYEINEYIKKEIACNTKNCTSSKCEFYNDCPFFISRKRIKDNNVLIVNHHLLFSNLYYKNSFLLDINNCIFIFDEGHKIIDTTRNTLNIACSTEDMTASLKMTKQLINTLSKKINKPFDNKILDSFSANIDRCYIFCQMLNYNDDAIHHFKNSIIDDNSKNLFNDISNEINNIEKTINKIHSNLKEQKIEISKDINESLTITLDFLNNIKKTVSFYHKTYDKNIMPDCIWIHKSNNKFILNGVELDISSFLYHNIWSKSYGNIITSATLTALGNFDYFKKNTGLNDCDNLMLESSFPFTDTPLNIPKMKYLPNVFSWNNEINDSLYQHIKENDATLVLFTSKQQMEKTLFAIEYKINCQILTQTKLNKNAIISEHKKNIDAGKGSIIFGLDSFSEGVDLKGKYLTHLIITKLSFKVPILPVEKSLSDYYISQNLNPFFKISLPYASIKLLQACGRLLRDEKDYGKITVFDRRLIDKPYGRLLLSSLPPYKIQTK